MPAFIHASFAIAGIAAAALPLAIHLLNRRRFRTVDWAAMDFLREAMRRNRRLLRIRDLLLLALRTACLLLFGLAMARPYLAATAGAGQAGQSVHAIVVVDNSLSMGYERLAGTLLDEAKVRIRAFIDRLPHGSQVSILPLCGSSAGFSFDPYRTKEDAFEALDGIAVVDRQASAVAALDLARQAARLAPELPTKRVVIVGDQQAINWPGQAVAELIRELPDLQIVQITADEIDNAWIADFRLRDGIADVDTPAEFLAKVRFQGREARRDVQVTLSIDGVPVASQSIDLEPGQARQLTFPYRFDVPTEPGRAVFVTASVSIPSDRLAGDDQRVLSVPVVASLPAVFVDSLGSDENPSQNLYGETFRLRRLLAPVTSRGDAARQLVQVRHTKLEGLDRETLADARLLVVGGVERPAAAAPLLREYIEQGGQLLLAAGGEFDPAAWTAGAWLNGQGILPAPLKSESVGQRPTENSATLQPFFIDPTTLSQDYFYLPQSSSEELSDLFRQPLFFKAVAVEINDEILRAVRNAEERTFDQLVAGGSPSAAEKTSAAGDRPAWLLWSERVEPRRSEVDRAAWLDGRRPRVLAAFSNRLPYLVERKIGAGRVIFVASGVGSDWNTLSTTNAIVLFDKLLRDMLLETVPRRNFTTSQKTVLPVEPQQRGSRFTLARPGRHEEPLAVDALGGESYGLVVSDMPRRGVYRVRAYRSEAGGRDAGEKLWEIPLAAGGPERESELAAISPAAFAERAGSSTYRWVSGGDPILIEGSLVRGQNWWKTLMGCALGCVALELLVLARPSWRRRPAT